MVATTEQRPDSHFARLGELPDGLFPVSQRFISVGNMVDNQGLRNFGRGLLTYGSIREIDRALVEIESNKTQSVEVVRMEELVDRHTAGELIWEGIPTILPGGNNGDGKLVVWPLPTQDLYLVMEEIQGENPEVDPPMVQLSIIAAHPDWIRNPVRPQISPVVGIIPQQHPTLVAAVA